MKKIAYCLLSDGMGGAENIVLQALAYFNSSDRFYIIVNNEIAINFKHVFPESNILNIGDLYIHRKYKSIRYLLNNRFYNIRRFLLNRKLSTVASYIRQNEIEIVHAHLDYALYLTLLLKAKIIPNLSVIFTVHSAFGFLKSKELIPQLSFDHINFNKVDGFVFVSDYVRDVYMKEISISNYRVIYNGIDRNNITAGIRTYKETESFNILYLGGEKLVKGYDVLLETVEFLVKRNTQINIRVLLLGPVADKDKLNKFLQVRNIDKYFDIVGFINPDQLSLYFNKAHLLFMPSRTEAMPLAAIEAVFHNLPIVATAVGGIPEIVSNNKNGFCEKLNPEDFSIRINSIMASYSLFVNEMKLYNNTIKNRFDLEVMCNKLMDFYSHF